MTPHEILVFLKLHAEESSAFQCPIFIHHINVADLKRLSALDVITNKKICFFRNNNKPQDVKVLTSPKNKK